MNYMIQKNQKKTALTILILLISLTPLLSFAQRGSSRTRVIRVDTTQSSRTNRTVENSRTDRTRNRQGVTARTPQRDHASSDINDPIYRNGDRTRVTRNRTTTRRRTNRNRSNRYGDRNSSNRNNNRRGNYYYNDRNRHNNYGDYYSEYLRRSPLINFYFGGFFSRTRVGQTQNRTYRQVVYVGAGWGNQHRETRLDIRAKWKQRITNVGYDYIDYDYELKSISIYEDGYYLGEVKQIPHQLRKMDVRVWNDGYVEQDREVSVIGNPETGMELISTPAYDGFLLDSRFRSNQIHAGQINFNRNRVDHIRRSRLFNPRNFNGDVPISLLPAYDRNEYWAPYMDDFYGDYDDSNWYLPYSQRNQNSDRISRNSNGRTRTQGTPRPSTIGRNSQNGRNTQGAATPGERPSGTLTPPAGVEQQYRTQGGANIRIRRETVEIGEAEGGN